MEGTTVLGRLTWQAAEVVDVVTETPRVKTIAFDVPGWPGHRAGQHVDIRLTGEDGYQAERSYSIASAPDGTRVELTVVRIDDGEVSPCLDQLQPGDQIEFRGPAGGYFAWEPSLGGPLLLVAGGSGIAPLMAMIRVRAAAGSDADTRLLFSSRIWDDVIYRQELERLIGNRLAVVHALTASQPTGWAGYARLVDADMLAEVGPAPAARPLVYVCGPTRFVEAAAEALVRLGHQPQAIVAERYGPTEAEMDALMLDGNAVAGLLREVFAVEMTTATETSGNCGVTEAVGATHVFRGAGIVLRCPHCDNALMKIVKDGARLWLDSSGLRTLQIAL